MGAGSVRARYLVYFQYLGTDFKYVLWASYPCPRPPRGYRRRGEHPSSSRKAAVDWRPRGWRRLSLGSSPLASGPGRPGLEQQPLTTEGGAGGAPGRSSLSSLTSTFPTCSGVAAVRGVQGAVGVQNYLEVSSAGPCPGGRRDGSPTHLYLIQP